MSIPRTRRWYEYADFPPLAFVGILLAMRGGWPGYVLLAIAGLLVLLNLTMLRERPRLRLALVAAQVVGLLAWVLWLAPQTAWVFGILALWGGIIVLAVWAASRKPGTQQPQPKEN